MFPMSRQSTNIVAQRSAHSPDMSSAWGLALIYGGIRSQVTFGSWGIALADVIIGLAAMLASDLPAIATKATDIGSWGVSGLLSDLIPHLAYGFTVAYTFEGLK